MTTTRSVSLVSSARARQCVVTALISPHFPTFLPCFIALVSLCAGLVEGYLTQQRIYQTYVNGGGTVALPPCLDKW